MSSDTTIHREEELYELWARRALTGCSFGAARGERVVVIAPGRRNEGAGPDFLDAVLLIDGAMRSGAVEMHLREADWLAHRHQSDPAYASVILHLLAVVPVEPSLPIVTVDAAALAAAAVEHDAGEELQGERSHPAALIAELAWARLLRRATAIVRGEPDLHPADRVRRALLRRLFDALGYGANRAAMGELIELLLLDEAGLLGEPADRIMARVLAASGLRRGALAAVGARFIEPASLDRLLAGVGPGLAAPSWRYDTRPANAPERRVWGAAILLSGIIADHLSARLFDAVRGRSFASAVSLLEVQAGREKLVGTGRAREIAVNALLPSAIALGVLAGDIPLIEGACLLYREAPSLAGNRLVESVERRYMDGVPLRGAFMQQGAIEFHQRYCSNDKSNLSFIAEETPSRGNGEGAGGSDSPHT
jgi:hypothetical protein